MVTACLETFVAALRRSKLLEAAQLDEVRLLRDRIPEPRDLGKELVRRGWLTPFQAHLLLRGRGHHLNLGQYLLLERLGEGGMSHVFKARHRALGRIAALKVLRHEHVSHPEAVARFYREIQAVARLCHPNIVHAYDASQFGNLHFLVMEYVPGMDLARLLWERGPLPVAEACDYIRQAALGLQHAHECGLVHRDLKPSNLIVTRSGAPPETRWGLVKILDLGLARLPAALFHETGTLTTQAGTVLGTADYIAPEQGFDARGVDIRADLYSLGCTLYHLLTGQAPFAGGTFTEKLLRHHLEMARPVEQLRPAVPARVAAVVRKAMAKAPSARYATPAELAAALAAAVGRAKPPAEPRPTVLDAETPTVLDRPRRPRRGKFRIRGTKSQTLTKPQTPNPPV